MLGLIFGKSKLTFRFFLKVIRKQQQFIENLFFVKVFWL